MITLRPYQLQAIEKVKQAFLQDKKHLVVQAPTGSGKTVIFSTIAKGISDKKNKVLILTDRAELLTQAGGSIKKTGVNSFYITAGCKYVSNAFNCYVAMSQTLRRRIKDKYWIDFLEGIDLLIIDECHKQEFNWIFEEIPTFKNKYILGFTATPKRGGKSRQMGLDYDAIIPTVSVKELIKQGYLVNDDYYGMTSPSMEGVEIDRMKGDYKENQMFQRFNSPQLYSGVVKNYLDICPNTKTLVFCVNIEHSIQTCLEFQKSGIDARFIVSDMSLPKLKESPTDGELSAYNERKKIYDKYKDYVGIYSGKREEIFKGFEDNEFPILINAGIATTGYDCPDIETIIINRATASVTLLLQMIGRGSRISPGKTHFNILDFGSNCSRLGYYTEDRLWGLWHDEYGGEGLPPVKQCGHDSDGKQITDKKGCKRLILAAYKICPFCGFVYPNKEIKEIILSGVVFDNEIKKAVKTKRIKDMSNFELMDYWKKKGHKSAWLWRQLWYKGRERAIREFAKEYDWNSRTVEKALDFCKNIS
jgi:superfamily II DNA or RNA helicase